MAISDFSDMMHQTVIVEPFLQRDDYGKPVYDTAVTVENSRVVFKDFWLRKADGSEINAKGIVWIGTYMRIYKEDKITLPDGTDHPVLQSESYPDEEEMSHTKVIFG